MGRLDIVHSRLSIQITTFTSFAIQPLNGTTFQFKSRWSSKSYPMTDGELFQWASPIDF
jgi:hypothetical protein